MFKIGDKVRIKKNFNFDRSYYGLEVVLKADMIGVVKSIYSYSYAVEFPYDIGGWDCSGTCKNNCGQIMKEKDIELVESRIRTKEDLVMLYNELKKPYK